MIFVRQCANDCRRQKHLIEVRNQAATAELRRVYQENVRAVFCVSNELYRENRSLPVERSRPWLELSRIISLRKYCLGLVAEQQLQAATTFMEDTVPRLVNAISLWVQSGSGQITLETREQVRRASAEVEKILKRVSLIYHSHVVSFHLNENRNSEAGVP